MNEGIERTHCHTPLGGKGNVSLAQMEGMVCVRHVWGLMTVREKGVAGIQWRGELIWVRRSEGRLLLMWEDEGGGAGWAVVRRERRMN